MKIPTRVRFLAVLGSAQLLVILLVYHEGSRQRVSAIVSALWKTGSVPNTSQANSSQPGDIYANLSLTTHLLVDEDQLPYCPSVSPYLRLVFQSLQMEDRGSEWEGVWIHRDGVE
ncbi:hypothetical protein chiPu_0028372 [Chiloscyllium punctatum]|uniref:Uncharacterized protein n=1 Tax=Chiloscyllium punctatum TaxID=137246 RepID=A0A401TP69_CHIPU|nr:hypothetical protein [Chiloscyllium punctatum]